VVGSKYIKGDNNVQINFMDSNKIDDIALLNISIEKEPDKFINIIKSTDLVVIKDKSYIFDYISFIPAELETMFSRIYVYVHEIEE